MPSNLDLIPGYSEQVGVERGVCGLGFSGVNVNHNPVLRDTKRVLVTFSRLPEQS
jgi:hypothetical protein